MNFPLSALSEISRGLQTSSALAVYKNGSELATEFDEYVMEIHRMSLQTCIFNDEAKFFQYVDRNLKGSQEVTALIFHDPLYLVPKVSSLFCKRKYRSITKMIMNFYIKDS